MKHPLFSIDNSRHSTKAGFREQTTSGSPVGVVSRERSERFVARSAVSLRENAVFFLLSLFLLTSCEEEIPYNGPDEDGLMVVSCIATAGEPLNVAVTRSVFFLEPIPEDGIDIALADASVTATVDGIATPLVFNAETSHFVGEKPVEAGSTIVVSATHPRYGTSTATVAVPSAVPVAVTTDAQPYRQPTMEEIANMDIHVYARTDSVWNVTLHVGDHSSNYYRLTISSSYTFRPTFDIDDIPYYLPAASGDSQQRPTTPNYSQPLPTTPNHSQPLPTIPNHSQPFLTTPNHSQQLPTTPQVLPFGEDLGGAPSPSRQTTYGYRLLQIEDTDEDADGGTLVRNDSYFVLPAATSRVLSTESNDILQFLGIDIGDLGESWQRRDATFTFTRQQLEAADGLLTIQVPLCTPQWYGGNYYWYHPDEHYIGYNYTYEGEDYENYDYGNPWDYVDPRSFVAQLTLTVETLSPEYYAYMQSLKDYENTDFSLIGLFSEPVQVYSNTTAGIGIVAAEATQTITLTRPYVFELPTE